MKFSWSGRPKYIKVSFWTKQLLWIQNALWLRTRTQPSYKENTENSNVISLFSSCLFNRVRLCRSEKLSWQTSPLVVQHDDSKTRNRFGFWDRTGVWNKVEAVSHPTPPRTGFWTWRSGPALGFWSALDYLSEQFYQDVLPGCGCVQFEMGVHSRKASIYSVVTLIWCYSYRTSSWMVWNNNNNNMMGHVISLWLHVDFFLLFPSSCPPPHFISSILPYFFSTAPPSSPPTLWNLCCSLCFLSPSHLAAQPWACCHGYQTGREVRRKLSGRDFKRDECVFLCGEKKKSGVGDVALMSPCGLILFI